MIIVKHFQYGDRNFKKAESLIIKPKVIKSFAKFTGKHSFLLQRPATLSERLRHRCCPVNFEKFLRTPFLQNTSGQMFLDLVQLKNVQVHALFQVVLSGQLLKKLATIVIPSPPLLKIYSKFLNHKKKQNILQALEKELLENAASLAFRKNSSLRILWDIYEMFF